MERLSRTAQSTFRACLAQVCTRLQLPDVKKLRDALELTYDELAFTSIQKVSRLTAAHELIRAWCMPVLHAVRAQERVTAAAPAVVGGALWGTHTNWTLF